MKIVSRLIELRGLVVRLESTYRCAHDDKQMRMTTVPIRSSFAIDNRRQILADDVERPLIIHDCRSVVQLVDQVDFM